MPNENLAHIPEAKRNLIAGVVNQLSGIPGMAAVVLGGSYASRTQHAGSDMDIGLYYHETDPFAIAEVRRAAESICGWQPADSHGFLRMGGLGQRWGLDPHAAGQGGFSLPQPRARAAHDR